MNQPIKPIYIAQERIQEEKIELAISINLALIEMRENIENLLKSVNLLGKKINAKTNILANQD